MGGRYDGRGRLAGDEHGERSSPEEFGQKKATASELVLDTFAEGPRFRESP